MPTTKPSHILVVEDEPSLAQIMIEYLQHAGFTTHHIEDGDQVIDYVKSHDIDLIQLDLMLPHRDGLDIYRELRTFTQVPVIMATAKVDEIDRLLGLELGADDYICKPYSPREVVVRIKNILRRSQASNQPVSTSTLHIDEKTMQARFYDHELSLTPAEFRLLKHFSDHIGQIFSRDQLIEQIYDDHRIVSDRTVDSHIKNLRKKMQQVKPESEHIKSIYSVGYKLDL